MQMVGLASIVTTASKGYNQHIPTSDKPDYMLSRIVGGYD